MAHFQSVQSIQVIANANEVNPNSSPNSQSNKTVLQLKISGATEVLSISCPSNNVAENIAHLIDGYCRLLNADNHSVWVRRGIKIFIL